MNEQAYTLAMYRVQAGQEEAFIAAWNELAETFSSLPHPPLWGTLIRHRTDRALFYSFGPWQSPEHVRAMRENPKIVLLYSRHWQQPREQLRAMEEERSRRTARRQASRAAEVDARRGAGRHRAGHGVGLSAAAALAERDFSREKYGRLYIRADAIGALELH